MSVGVGTTNGTGNKIQKDLSEELDLEINDEKNEKNNVNAQQSETKNADETKADQKTESKKQKITVEISAADIKEIDILVTLEVYKSRDEFIVEAVKEKKSAVMEKIKAAAKKK